MTRLFLTLALGLQVSVTYGQIQSREESIAGLRSMLEGQFRATVGIGFKSFDCDLPPDLKQGQNFACTAVDEEGDRFFYGILTQTDGNISEVSMSQPASQLPTEGLALIDAPCRAFLDQFAQQDWSTMHGQLSPALQKVVSVTSLQEILAPMLALLGRTESVSPSLYANPSENVHRLEYQLATTNGPAFARFRLHFESDEEARILAFLVAPAPGSDLHHRTLSEVGARSLSSALGRTIAKIDAPLGDLSRIGDVVQGMAILKDNSKVRILVSLKSSLADFDDNDYRFHLLDAAWLIRRYLESAGTPSAAVRCPTSETPDGESMECEAVFENGPSRFYTLSRRGTEHRLLPSPAQAN